MRQRLLMGFSVLILSTSSALAALGADGPVIPAGTTLHVDLSITLSTGSNQVGDPFTAIVEEPIFQKGEEIVPEGSTLIGHVSFVKRPGRLRGVAEMRLTPEAIITHDHMRYQISAGLENEQGAEGSKIGDSEGTIKGQGKGVKNTAKDAGIGTAVGAGGGMMVDGTTGAMYGAGIGALAGVIRALGVHGRELTLHNGTELTFVLARDAPGKPTSKNAPDAPLVIQQN